MYGTEFGKTRIMDTIVLIVASQVWQNAFHKMQASLHWPEETLDNLLV